LLYEFASDEVSLLGTAALLATSIRVAVSGTLGASGKATGGHVSAGLGLDEGGYVSIGRRV